MRFLILPLAFFSAPALAEGLPNQTPEILLHGEMVFQDECAACHGEQAKGESGPDIRGYILPDLIAALRGIEDMPEFELPEEDNKAIASWLMSLAPDEAAVRLRLQEMRKN